MTNIHRIVQEIDEMLVALNCPVSSKEKSDGWSETSKRAMKEFFEDLRIKLLTGEPLPPLNITRGMDHWGVFRGELLENAAHISNELRKVST